ncbi:hypothetical protein ACH5A3_39565 [Streptomyces echinatus]|uniref:hypothetical protein n=1 Tax=Streptomyces echinatus TaxID=67293 RepID=UPI003795BF63
MYSPPSDPAAEQRMRAHHQRAAKAMAATVEPGGEFWGWAGRTLGAPARTVDGTPAWLRLVSQSEARATGKLWEGAWEAQRMLGDLDGRRPTLIGLHDVAEDGVAYRAELSVRVEEPVLSDDPILRQDLPLSDQWWADLAQTLQKLAAASTDRIAVRQQYMERVIPQFVGIPAPQAASWSTAHGDLHWANLVSPLRILDWEGWGTAPAGFDGAMLYAYSLLCPATAARVRETFPMLGGPEALAGEATVCAMLLQTVDRGDNTVLHDPLRAWAQEIRRRCP